MPKVTNIVNASPKILDELPKCVLNVFLSMEINVELRIDFLFSFSNFSYF